MSIKKFELISGRINENNIYDFRLFYLWLKNNSPFTLYGGIFDKESKQFEIIVFNKAIPFSTDNGFFWLWLLINLIPLGLGVVCGSRALIMLVTASVLVSFIIFYPNPNEHKNNASGT